MVFDDLPPTEPRVHAPGCTRFTFHDGPCFAAQPPVEPVEHPPRSHVRHCSLQADHGGDCLVHVLEGHQPGCTLGRVHEGNCAAWGLELGPQIVAPADIVRGEP